MVPIWVLVAAITACVALLWFTRRKRVDDAAKTNDDYLAPTEPLMIPLPPVDVVPKVKGWSFKILAPALDSRGEKVMKTSRGLIEPFNMSTSEEEQTEFSETNDALRNLRQAMMGKVQKRARKAKTECWIWTGSSNLRFRGYSVRRVLWMWFRGSLSDNEMLKNGCGDDYCVAPDHQTATLRRKTVL